jgi:hypothetical protein
MSLAFFLDQSGDGKTKLNEKYGYWTCSYDSLVPRRFVVLHHRATRTRDDTRGKKWTEQRLGTRLFIWSNHQIWGKLFQCLCISKQTDKAKNLETASKFDPHFWFCVYYWWPRMIKINLKTSKTTSSKRTFKTTSSKRTFGELFHHSQ